MSLVAHYSQILTRPLVLGVATGSQGGREGQGQRGVSRTCYDALSALYGLLWALQGMVGIGCYELEQAMANKTHADVLRPFRRVGSFLFANIINDPEREWLSLYVPQTEDQPGVYAWVEEQEGREPIILYIGSTSQSVWRRHRNHDGGLRRSSVGKRHLERISKRIREGRAVTVWAYYPKPVRFEGERIAIHRSLEEHLLATIEPKPALNREGRGNQEADGS